MPKWKIALKIHLNGFLSNSNLHFARHICTVVTSLPLRQAMNSIHQFDESLSRKDLSSDIAMTIFQCWNLEPCTSVEDLGWNNFAESKFVNRIWLHLAIFDGINRYSCNFQLNCYRSSLFLSCQTFRRSQTMFHILFPQEINLSYPNYMLLKLRSLDSIFLYMKTILKIT